MSSSSSVDLFSYSAASSSSCAYAASFSIREVQRREYVKSIVFGEDIGPKVARFAPDILNCSKMISQVYYSGILNEFCQRIGISKYYQVTYRAICNIKSLPGFNRDKISLRLRTCRIFCDLFKNIKSVSDLANPVGENFLRTLFPNFDLSSPSNVIDYICPEILEQMHNWIEDSNLMFIASRITNQRNENLIDANLRTPVINVYKTVHERAQGIRLWLERNAHLIQNVVDLNFSNLGLTLIPGEINQFPNLGGVDLSNNKITHITANTFAGLRNLETINFNHNQITHIAPNAFMGLWNLDFLFLEHNRITQIAANTFTGLRNLRLLSLEHNLITQIVADAFMGLGNLQWLHLRNNRITQIVADAFMGLGNLESLDLSYNLIAQIAADAFMGLESLRLLELDHNQITQIAANTFTGLGNLSRLDLSDNRIAEISADAFRGSENLQILYLRNNSINAQISANTSYGGLENLIRLDLGGNPIPQTRREYLDSLHHAQLENIRRRLGFVLEHNQWEQLELPNVAPPPIRRGQPELPNVAPLPIRRGQLELPNVAPLPIRRGQLELPNVAPLPIMREQPQSHLDLTFKGIFLLLISIPSKIIYFVIYPISTLFKKLFLLMF